MLLFQSLSTLTICCCDRTKAVRATDEEVKQLREDNKRLSDEVRTSVVPAKHPVVQHLENPRGGGNKNNVIVYEPLRASIVVLVVVTT